jgi:hypothetical protein
MADKPKHIGEFFKFLRDKEERPIPLQAQFTFTPEDIDWEGLAYNEKDLNLIKDTDNIDKIVWDKVDQSKFDILKWVIENSSKNIDKSNININEKGIVGLLHKNNRSDIIDWDKYKIDSYVKAVNAIRFGEDNVNWNNIDYSDYPTLKILSKRKPEVIDKSKVDMSDEKLASIFSEN